jgi:hypothetical protein
VAILFFARRIAEREEGRDPALLLAGILGLAGGAMAALGSGAIAVTALPLAAAIAAGAALAGSGRGRTRPGSPWPARIYALAALLALTPLELARWHYDRAVVATGAEAEAHLAKAMRLDPAFPLYPMRLALLQGSHSSGPAAEISAAELALGAARKGRAVPSLWLVAGILGYPAERSWAGDALERACALDPLDPFPPFYGMLVGRADPDAPARGAQALLNEPRLAAAIVWEHHPDRLALTLAAAREWPDVDAGWKGALFAAVPPVGARNGPIYRVALAIDTDEREALSLTAFRRRPWPVRWPLVEVRQSVWESLRVPPAAASKGTAPVFFHFAPCRRRARNEQDLLTR